MIEQQTNHSQLIKIAADLWQQGRHNDAIQNLIAIVNQTPKRLPRMPCLQLAFYLFQLKQYSAAETVLSQYLKQNPQDYQALENRGIMRSRQGNSEAAYADFKQVITHCPASVNAWDALTAELAKLGRTVEARESGAEVLAIKDRQCLLQKAVNINWPTITPSQWDYQQTNRADVIAFSLWGNHPRYLRGAVRNLLELPNIYPDWVCRFYLDDTVPEEFQTLAQKLGGQVIIEQSGQTQRQKLGWRFQVAGDLNVRRFLVRDVDSVVSKREAHAVQAWLSSDCWFHVMRDWWTHTDLILAGMWGGRAGLLEPLMPQLYAYQSGRLETANVDQWFLRDCVWHTIRASCLIHDRFFKALSAHPWPDPNPSGNFHVGQDESAVRAQEQTKRLGSLVEQYNWLRFP